MLTPDDKEDEYLLGNEKTTNEDEYVDDEDDYGYLGFGPDPPLEFRQVLGVGGAVKVYFKNVSPTSAVFHANMRGTLAV